MFIKAVRRSELREALTGLTKIIDRGIRIDALQRIRIGCDGARLAMAATNLDETALCSLGRPDECGRPVACLVDPKQLRALCKGPTGDVLILECRDESMLRVHQQVAGDVVSCDIISDTQPGDWPQLPQPGRCAEVPGFIEAYRRCVPFVSTDESRRVLQGVLLDNSTAEARVVATDGRRLTASAPLNLPVRQGRQYIIPASRLLYSKAFGPDCRIGITERADSRLVTVKSGNWTYVAKCIDGTYPNWRMVIPPLQDNDGIEIAPQAVKDVLHMLESIPGDGEALLACKDGNAYVCVRKPENGWAVMRLQQDRALPRHYHWTGLSRIYLKEALQAGFRRFEWQDSMAPATSLEAGGALHVLMPLRLDEPKIELSAGNGQTTGIAAFMRRPAWQRKAA